MMNFEEMGTELEALKKSSKKLGFWLYIVAGVNLGSFIFSIWNLG